MNKTIFNDFLIDYRYQLILYKLLLILLYFGKSFVNGLTDDNKPMDE
jgi:hypothetical protein